MIISFRKVPVSFFIYLPLGFYIVLFGIFFLTLEEKRSGFIRYYLNLGLVSASLLSWSLVILYFALVASLFLFIVQNGFRGRSLGESIGEFVKRAKGNAKEFFRWILHTGTPIMFGFPILGLVIGYLNQFNATRLQDGFLMQADFLLTGTFPALVLPSLSYPFWFIAAVDFSFFYLGIALALLAAIVLRQSRKLFQEAAATFFFGIAFMLLIWLLFPALSPHDRYLDNVYGLPVSSEIQKVVEANSPNPMIQEVLNDMRERKQGLSVFPTTTMPSAHVAWAGFLAYYAWRARKELLIPAGIFALLSATGTVLFAQHYFVDIPVGLTVFLGSLFIVKAFSKEEPDRNNGVPRDRR